MNDDHVIRGRKYRYDPDFDCYYRVYTREELTLTQQYGWLAVVAILTAICYGVSA